MSTTSKKVKEIAKMLEQGHSTTEIENALHVGDNTITRVRRSLREEYKKKGVDLEIIIESTRLAKKTQRFSDTNRIERKTFRNYARVENAVGDYSKEIVRLLKKYSIPKYKKEKKLKGSKAVGILQLTDLHFNELIDIPANRYDFEIASKRLKAYVTRAKGYFDLFKIDNILIALTGDMLNSDRRPDEFLSEATNRSKATFLAICLLSQAIEELNQSYNTKIVNVVGNESRLTKDLGWTDLVATDNYDFTIYNILKLVFKNKGIVFLSNNDPNEQVVKINGCNILFLHGTSLGSNLEKDVTRLKGKYTAQNIMINFIVFGHKHSCRIGDTYARSSSLCGANAYSSSALGLESRASQNIHIIFADGRRDGIKIDLQNTKNIVGYDFKKEIEAYNPKSVSKSRKKTIVTKIIS